VSIAPSPEDARTADVIIIGGGLIGLSTAYALLRNGRRPLVVEALPDVGSETSFANGGLFTPSMAAPWNTPDIHRRIVPALFDPHAPMKLRFAALPSLAFWGLRFLHNSAPVRHRAVTAASFVLARYSTEATRALRDEERLEFDNSECGTLTLFRNAQAMAASQAHAHELTAQGMRAEFLDPAQAIRLEPRLAECADMAGVLYFPEDMVGDARRFCVALAARIEQMGGLIRRGVSATRIVVEDGRVTGIEAGGTLLRARDVVIAAGVASTALAQRVGVALPIAPVKGYSLTIDAAAVVNPPRIPVLDEEMHAVVVPIGDRIRIVGTADFAGPNRRIDPLRIEALTRLLRSLYPRLAGELDVAGGRAWAGLRPMSADGLPFIGATKVDGLWVNAGHGHLGWTMAVGSGRLAADMICGKTPEPDPTPYRVTR
jgi:D-amino-acid dehydrogenase